MHRSRLTCAVVLIVMLGVSVSMTSCGGGAGGTNPDLVLLGFNVPNLSGIPLNQALIFTFSADINPQTITPDSLRVVGTEGPFFEETVVDGNLVALLPTTPNFADYSDAGLQPDIEYTVSLTEFPAVTTIESTTGKPLLEADTFTFRTLPAKSLDIVSNIRCNGADGILGTADDDTPASPSFFIETRRPIRRGVPWTLGGKEDDAGCLQNAGPGNELYAPPTQDPAALQSGSGPGARLVCLQNEGSPRVIEALSIPRHDTQAFGDASAVAAGFIDLPAIRVKINEPLDPLTVEPFFAGIPLNIQLWRVALKNGDFAGPLQINTNKPIVVQSIEDTEIILVPAGPVPQGIYLINITPAVKDLAGCPLRTNDRPDPSLNGYDTYESNPAFSAAISPGYRIYFKTLEVPDTPLSIIEDFNNNLAEWGDNDSGTGTFFPEPGLYKDSLPDGGGGGFLGDPLQDAPGTGTATFPFGARTFGGLGGINGDPNGTLGGQTTTALWNGSGTAIVGGPITNVNGYRFLNIPTIFPSTTPVDEPNGSYAPAGSLQAVHQPWRGNGQDGAFDSQGSDQTWNTDTGSLDNDGVYQFESVLIRAGDTVTVTGSKPLLILCQETFLVQGSLVLSGGAGGHGFDTDGSLAYTNAGAFPSGGAGGVGGPGGGAGGGGADTTIGNATGGETGGTGKTLFDTYADQDGTEAGGVGPAGVAEVGVNDGSCGGGGGGLGAVGSDGFSLGATTAAGGAAFGTSAFLRSITLFNPDRGYCNNSNAGGGGGGGGGSSDDDNGASETGNGSQANEGDDGGGGGGGGGGAMWVLAGDTVEVASGGSIIADGGPGGNTYDENDQFIDPGGDGDLGTDSDNIFQGLVSPAPATASGDGGPGGGGAGGSIFLVSKVGITIAGTLSAQGGAGGTSGDVARVGGAGAEGHIGLGTYGAGPISVTGTVTPTPTSGGGFITPVEECSVGQSDWVDLFTPNTDFAPLVMGVPEVPTFNANFTLDGGSPGYLELPTGAGGGGQTAGVDFDAKLEFQGADDLNDGDGNILDPIDDTPTEADGLTQWFDVSLIDNIDMKRYIRWRWRFFAKDGWGTFAGDPTNLPLPTVLDVTIPFVKN